MPHIAHKGIGLLSTDISNNNFIMCKKLGDLLDQFVHLHPFHHCVLIEEQSKDVRDSLL